MTDVVTEIDTGTSAVRWVRDGLNAGRLDVLHELIADGFTLHLPPHITKRPLVGVAGATRFIEDFHRTWSSPHTVIEEMLVGTGKVVLRLRTAARHRGPFRGAPPTGHAVEFTQTCVFELAEDGRLTRGWVETDHLGIAITVGLAPPYGVTGPRKAFAWAVRTGFRRVGRRLVAPKPGEPPVGAPDVDAEVVVTDAGVTDKRREANSVALRRWIAECVNQQAVHICPEIFHADYEGHSPPHAEPEPVFGPDGYAKFVTGILTGFPDAVASIEDLVAVGDRVVCRVRMSGTHLGEYRELVPTGKPFAISQIVVCRMRDGKIVESWQEIDALGLLLQLGYVPTKGFSPLGIVRWLGALGASIQRTARKAHR